VIDYKLGRGIPDLRDLEAGYLLQAPLYALALQRLFDVEVVGAEYVSLMSGKRRGLYRDEKLGPRTAANPPSRASKPSFVGRGGLVLTQPEFAAKLESAAARARECVGMILRGELPRGPREECPTWCGYRGICRMDAWTLRALQAQRGQG
jgi:hypothetical protein